MSWVEKIRRIVEGYKCENLTPEEREVKLSERDVDMSVSVWEKKSGEEESTYTYYSKRGVSKKILLDDVARKLFGVRWIDVTVMWEEDPALANKALCYIRDYIARNYVKEKQIFVDKYGKKWVFEKFVEKD